MNIIYKKTAELIPYEQNTKKHDKQQIDNVAKSIEKFGFVQPVVVDKNNVVIIGHCRLLAAKKLKLKEVPCYMAEDLTEEQVRQLRIVDNKTNESEWDEAMLELEFADIDLSEFMFDFDLPAFEDAPTEIVEDDFDEEEIEGKEPVAKLGDIWQLGRHRLMCGDSTKDIDKLINGAEIELLMTDPPYGINADKMTMGNGAKDFHRGSWDAFKPDVLQFLPLAKKHCIWGGIILQTSCLLLMIGFAGIKKL